MKHAVLVVGCTLITLALVSGLTNRIADVGPIPSRTAIGPVPPNELPRTSGFRAIWNRGEALTRVVRTGDVYVELVDRRTPPFVWVNRDRVKALQGVVWSSSLILVGQVTALEPREVEFVSLRDDDRFVYPVTLVTVRVIETLKNDLANTVNPEAPLQFTIDRIDERWVGDVRVVHRAVFERVPLVGRTYLWGIVDNYGTLAGGFAGPFELTGDRLVPMFQPDDTPYQPFLFGHGMRIARAAAARPTPRPRQDAGHVRMQVLP